MDIQEVYVDRFDTIRQQLGNLERAITILSNSDALNLSDISFSLPPREREELCYTLAYTMTVLYTASLKCQGTDASKHSIHKENDRLKSYLDKLVFKDDTRPAGVDAAASARLIHHHVRQ